MESKRVPAEETADELCRRADAEQDFEKLLELANKLQKLIEARRKTRRSGLRCAPDKLLDRSGRF